MARNSKAAQAKSTLEAIPETVPATGSAVMPAQAGETGYETVARSMPHEAAYAGEGQQGREPGDGCVRTGRQNAPAIRKGRGRRRARLCPRSQPAKSRQPQRHSGRTAECAC